MTIDIREVLIQLRYAQQEIEHAKGMLQRGGAIPPGELRAHINSAINALKTGKGAIKQT